jgi:PhnB protein
MATIVDVHPKLVVTDGAGAIEYYRSCLGAREQSRFTMPDGKVVHAALTIGGTTVSVKDEADGDLAPTSTGGIVAGATNSPDRNANGHSKTCTAVTAPALRTSRPT